MTNTRRASSGAPTRAYELYPDGRVEDVPVRHERPVLHTVKFRHAEEPKRCVSEQCPHGQRIEAGEKYARVQRIGPRRRGITEFLHPKCYDYEFDQGA
jgi:hypothetical protein